MHAFLKIEYICVRRYDSYLCYANFPGGGVMTGAFTFVRNTFLHDENVGKASGGVREEHRPRPCLRATSVLFNAKAEVRFDERQRGTSPFPLARNYTRAETRDLASSRRVSPSASESAQGVPLPLHYMCLSVVRMQRFSIQAIEPKSSA